MFSLKDAANTFDLYVVSVTFKSAGREHISTCYVRARSEPEAVGMVDMTAAGVGWWVSSWCVSVITPDIIRAALLDQTEPEIVKDVGEFFDKAKMKKEA